MRWRFPGAKRRFFCGVKCRAQAPGWELLPSSRNSQPNGGKIRKSGFAGCALKKYRPAGTVRQADTNAAFLCAAWRSILLRLLERS